MKKNIAIAIWLIIGSSYLYVLSFAKTDSASLGGYIHWLAMLLLANIYFRVADNLFDLDNSSLPNHLWNKLTIQMILSVIWFAVVISGVFIMPYGVINNNPIVIMAGVSVILLGTFLVYSQVFKSEKTFETMREYQSIPY